MNVPGGMRARLEAELPRCPPGALIRQIYDSAIEFAKRSTSWRKWLHLDVVANQTAYRLRPATGANVTSVSEVVLGEDEACGYPVPRSEYTLHVVGGDMTLLFRGSLGSARSSWIHVRIILEPIRGLVIDDEEWFIRWQDAIESHVVYMLARKQRRPWTNIMASETAYRQYLRELERAKASVLDIDGGSFNGGVNV